MKRGIAIAVGAVAGLVLGIIVVAGARSALEPGAPPCPTGWTRATAPPIPDAHPLGACTRTPAAPEARPALLAVYRTSGPAANVVDRAMTAAARRSGLFAQGAVPPRDAPERQPAAGGAVLAVEGRTDTREVPLEADVYFLAAGRRFGLLSIVHVPDVPFAQPANTARWLETITGTSPWGSDNAGPVTARCPEGFETRPVPSADTVLSCVTGVGTSRFAAISLSVNEGGFGREEDRARVASAIASRVAQAQGTNARVVEGPLPFTLARNVDALRTRVETGERVPVATRVLVAHAPGAAPDVMAVGVGEADAELSSALRGTLEAGRLLAPAGGLRSNAVAALIAVVCALAGAGFAALMRRK